MSHSKITPREEFYKAALTASRLFAVSLEEPLQDALSHLSELLVDELRACLVTVGVLDRENLSLNIISKAGQAIDYAQDLILSASSDNRMGLGPAGKVLRSGLPMVASIPDAFPEELADLKERARLFGIGGSALAPIFTRDGLWGLLSVYRGENEDFSPDILPVLEGFAGDVGTFIERRGDLQELRTRRYFQKSLEALHDHFLKVPPEPEIYRDLVRILVEEKALPSAWVLVGRDSLKGRFYALSDPDVVPIETRRILEHVVKYLEGLLGLNGEISGIAFPLFLNLSEIFPSMVQFSFEDLPAQSVMVFPFAQFPDHAPQTLLLAGFSFRTHPPEAVVDLLSQIASSTQLALVQRRDRERLERYSSFYRAIGQSSQLMARHPSPQHLFDSLCEIIVKETGLDLAFISLVEEGMKVRVVSARGRAAAFLEGVVFSIDPEDEGRCLIHSRTLHSDRVLSIPFLEGWLCSDEVREQARPWNLKNTLTAAIRRDGKAIGIIGLITGEEGFFDGTLENLLEDLSRDITFSLEFQDRQERLAKISATDNLTGLPNRNDFSEKVSLCLSDAREGGKAVAVGILDLDGFKGWNDAYGHNDGDRLLKDLAALLRKILPERGLIARLGGDEFGFCIPGSSLELLREQTDALSEKILQTVRSVDQGLNLVTGSVGWALYPQVGENFGDLLAHADEALYVAKKGGRNTVRYFETELANALERRIETHRNFPLAFEKGELIFWLQPQLDCRTGRIEGAEMLVRWVKGDRVLPPGAFIPEVEKDPVLIQMLGVHALTCARDLRTRLRRLGHSFRVSLNIGASHFLHQDFLGQVDLAVGMDGGKGLVIEVTESAALEDMSRTTRLVEDLKKKGFGVALDDFGRGYSSLHYAADLSMTEVKLDAYFLRRFRSYTNAFAVVGSTLLLADLSGSRLVAEGIEFSEDLDLWLRMGGRHIQGYLLARPMPEKEFLDWLSRPVPPSVTSSPPVYPVEDLPFLEYAFRPRTSFERMNHPKRDCSLDSWFDLRGVLYYHLPAWSEARDSHRALHMMESENPEVIERFCRAMETLRGEIDAYRLTVTPPS